MLNKNKVRVENIEGTLIKEDGRYIVQDNKLLQNLVLSSTKLRANQSTTGHRHSGQEEVYMFTKGHGEMELDHRIFKVREGDIVLVEDNVFHKVHNTGHYWLEFICVFNGERHGNNLQ